jgi:uncharacterized protein YndB with AHSA1/START domain
MTQVRLETIIDAPAEAVWALLFAWERQGEWMVGTSVEVTGGDGASVGSTVAAWTGAGPVGFLDTMTVTRWEPPYRCDVLHTGRVVKGTGTFEVQPLPGGRSRFIWSEDLDLPLGAVGRAGWPVARPAFLAGVRRSLDRLAELVEAEHRAATQG